MLTSLSVKLLVELYRQYKDKWMEKHFRDGKYIKVEVDDVIIELVVRITPRFDDMIPEEAPDHDRPS